MAFACALRAPLIVLFLGAFFAQQAIASPNNFLRKVSIREVEVDLQATLSTLLQGTSAAATRRFAIIEARIWQTFQALPKNSAGRLAPPAVRYIVHDYFAREHGWLIKGLEPHGMQSNVTNVHDVNILLDKAPAVVEGLLEAKQAGRGLSFSDVVTMAVVLEQMMFDESVTLLQAAYRLNGLSVADQLQEAELHTVLKSYLLLFGQGSKANLFDAERHQVLLEGLRTGIEVFERDTVFNYEFKHRHTVNAFRPRLYSFQSVAEIMEELAQQYGKWQNAECRDMKAHLVELDPEGLGRVPLGLFYGQPPSASYHFSESADYLRKIGALDEETSGNPKVIINNYVGGPSNCIASSSYYSVCCLSECAEIMAELEHHVAAPSASPERLLSLMSHVSDKVLPDGLATKLQAIAARHDGEVPLHGRLFAQWLHFALPHECPYPSVVSSSTALTASQWLDGGSSVSAEEREQHLASVSAGLAPSERDFDIDSRWSEHEVLPVHGVSSEPYFQFGTGTARAAVQLVAIVVALRSALAAWRGARGSDGAAKSKKDDDCALGFRV